MHIQSWKLFCTSSMTAVSQICKEITYHSCPTTKNYSWRGQPTRSSAKKLIMKNKKTTGRKSSRLRLWARSRWSDAVCAEVSSAHRLTGGVSLSVHSHCIHLVGAINLQPIRQQQRHPVDILVRCEVPHWLWRGDVAVIKKKKKLVNVTSRQRTWDITTSETNCFFFFFKNYLWHVCTPHEGFFNWASMISVTVRVTCEGLLLFRTTDIFHF